MMNDDILLTNGEFLDKLKAHKVILDSFIYRVLVSNSGPKNHGSLAKILGDAVFKFTVNKFSIKVPTSKDIDSSYLDDSSTYQQPFLIIFGYANSIDFNVDISELQSLELNAY